MTFDLPAGELVLLAGALICGGFLTGILSGLFGVGGGGILVPVLYELFGFIGLSDDVRMHLAVGTSFAVIAPTSLRAAYAHFRRDSIDIALLRLLAPVALVGIVAGAIVARIADASAFQFIWVISAALLSASILFKPTDWSLKGDLNSPSYYVPIGSVIGFVATLMGVGGGAQITATLALLGRPMHQAVGTASGFSAFLAIPALIGFIWAGWNATGLPPGSVGYFSLIGAAAIIPASVLAAPLGARLAHGLPKRKLEIAFALFLLLVGMRFLFALFY
ncbi:MAG: sulfite exporter TauE/SafE family protein [Hyphomicrobiales bacterium]|nr:sulfite exporter TauE/SafE family protein [Hyphomicrobiales bacterium]